MKLSHFFIFVLILSLAPGIVSAQCDPDGVWLERQAYSDSDAILRSRGGCVRGLVLRSPLELFVDTLQIAMADSVGWCLVWNGTAWEGAPCGSGGGDPSVTNEGILGVGAGGANTAELTTNTSTGNPVTISGSNTVLVTETTSANGGTVTLQADTSLLATLNDLRGSTFDTVADYDDLRLYDKQQKIVYVSQDNLEGFFERVASGTDDNGTIIDGVFTWQRVYDRSRLNVKWFGAVGDSATDDGAAIQAAFDVALARKNTAVYFPAGKYRTTQTIDLYKPRDVSIVGAGMDDVFIFPVNVTGFLIHTDTLDFKTFGKYGVLEARNMFVKDLAILKVGSNTFDTPAHGIEFRGGFETKIENVRIEEFRATGGAAQNQCVGLKMVGSLVAASPEFAAEAVQHRTLENVYISECDTGLSVQRHNTLYFYNLRLDLNWHVGMHLMNNVIWENGMCQGSGKAGIYIDNWTGNQFRGVFIRGIHFENNSWNGGYGAIYKPSTVTMTNFEVEHCLFSQSNSDTVAYLNYVRDGFWGNNKNYGSTTDTFYVHNCNNFVMGLENYYVFGRSVTGSKIRYLNGDNGVSTEAYNGLTINRENPGDYALNVGGTAIVETSAAIGIDAETGGAPAQTLHVQGTARVTGSSGISTSLMGRDGDGDISAVTAGENLSLSGNTLSVSGIKRITRALPTVVGDIIQIGYFTKTNGVGAYEIKTQAQASGVSVSKNYIVSAFYNSTSNNWRILQPITSSGVFSGNNYVLEIRGNNNVDSLRVRRTGGTSAATFYADLSWGAPSITTFTEQSGTASPTAVTDLYDLAALAQSANRAGVGTVSPAQTLHVQGTMRVTGSDGTATSLMGRDADGDVSAVSLASGLTMPGGVLTPADNSATNEAWTIDAQTGDTEVIATDTVLFDGTGGIATDYDAATNTLTIDGSGIVPGGTNYQTFRDDGVAATQQPNANFVSTSTVTATLTNDGANSETEITMNVPTDGITATQIAAGAVGTSEIATNAVANDDIRQSAGLSVVGRSANTTGNVADINGTVQTSPQVRGTSLGFHPIPTKTFFSTVSMPTAVGNTREIGVLTHNEGGRGATAEVFVNFAVSGAAVSKRYFIPLVFNSASSGWVKLLPITSAGIYDGTQDFEVEMRTNTSGSPSGGIDTLRVVRTAGTVAGTADVVIQYHGSDVDGNTFTATSNTSTSAVTATFSRQAIAQVANRLGVNEYAPVRSLDVNGEVRIRDLTTDTPVDIVGADADGDLGRFAKTDEITMSGGTLGTNFSTTISPSTLTAGVTNNWSPTGLATAWIIRVAGDNEFQIITGISAPSFNKSLKIWNVGSNSILLANDHQSSTAGNRFTFGRDVVLFAGKSVEIQYDVTSSRWRLLSKAGIYEDVEHLHFNERFSAAVSGTSGDYSFWEIVSENGIAAVAPVSGRLSGISVNTGSDVAGGGYVASKEQFVNLNTSSGTATWGYCKAVINTPTTLSNGTDNYVLRVGFLADALQSDLADGAYFYYNHSINSGAWSCYTQNGGTSQNNNSGVTVAANTVYVLEVYYHPNATAVFFVNGTRVAENNSNLPSNDNMKVVAEIEKGGGTAQRDLNVYTLQTSVALVD